MVIQSTHLQNDEFGYSCYVISIPAPPALREKMLEIERLAGQERAKIPAHITVKGTFYGIEDLDELIAQTRRVASNHGPFSLPLVEKELIGPDHSVILGFPVTPEIQSLHDDLVATIAPLSRPAYKDDPYRVHMSVVNEIQPEGVELAKRMIDEMVLPESIDVSTIELTARVGVAWGGRWEQIELFDLG